MERLGRIFNGQVSVKQILHPLDGSTVSPRLTPVAILKPGWSWQTAVISFCARPTQMAPIVVHLLANSTIQGSLRAQIQVKANTSSIHCPFKWRLLRNNRAWVDPLKCFLLDSHENVNKLNVLRDYLSSSRYKSKSSICIDY